MINLSYEYDAAIIGGGPGGYTAAIRLGQLGKKAILIEKDKLGGTCLNRGCIPTKSLLQSAQVYKTVLDCETFGITAKEAALDYNKINKRKDEVVTRLRNGIKHLINKAGIDVISAAASFINKNIISAGGEEITAANIIIATGSEPAMPPITGIDSEGVINSDTALTLDRCPHSIAIIGGGVIGVEFATLFSSLGSKVTIIEMLGEILPGIDPEIAKLTRIDLIKKGVDIFTGAKIVKIEPGVSVSFVTDKAKTINADRCIAATGRKPVTEALGLFNIGLITNRGYIRTDDHMRTGIPGVYAIGDVTGKIQLAHVASAQGIVAAHNIAGKKRKIDYGIVPACVYSKPEIAYVGLTEEQVKQKGISYKTGYFNTAANGRSLIMGETAGMVKIITETKTGEVLGCHIMAQHATDMIGEICTLMRSGGTVDELIDTIHPHPTVSEIIMEAAHDTENLSIHK